MKKSSCTKKLLCLVLVLAAALCLCACGSKSGNSYYGGATTAASDYSQSVMDAPAAAEPAEAESGFYNDSKLDAGMEFDARPNLPEGVKLIYTASFDLESTEFDDSAAGLKKLVNDMGGYFESSSVDNYDSYRYAYYTVRVPAESFNAFCDSVGSICQVNNVSRGAQDISEAYYDTASRLETQRTKLQRLQELLAKAESMEDIITIESAISETEFNIESLTGTLKHYDSLVGYSTVTISLREVYKLSEVEPPAVGFGSKLAAAFKRGCTRFVDGVQDLMLGFAGAWVGWLIFLALAAAVAIPLVRFIRRRRGEKRRSKESSDSDGK